MSWAQVSLYVLLGVVLPVLALAVNYNLFGGERFDTLYTVGGMFMLPRPAYLYITISSGIVTLFLWIFLFRKYGKRFNGFIAGILLFNTIFYCSFGIAAVFRLLCFPIWLPPFCAAPVLLLSGLRALKIARSVMSKWMVVATSIGGFLFVIIISLVIVRQPWGLVKHLPDAKGADLSSMNLSGIYLDHGPGITLQEANLSNANLSYARLFINMSKANLQKANLSHAFLWGVNLTQANLKGVNLNRARIYQVDFTGADFQGASLGFHAQGRIRMNEVNLCGADLREMTNCEGVYHWTGAVYNSVTLWPKDFDPDEAGMVLINE